MSKLPSSLGQMDLRNRAASPGAVAAAAAATGDGRRLGTGLERGEHVLRGARVANPDVRGTGPLHAGVEGARRPGVHAECRAVRVDETHLGTHHGAAVAVVDGAADGEAVG